MSPQFGFSPADVQAGFPVHPKDDYEFIIGEPTSYYNKATKPGKEDNYGVRFTLVIAEGPLKGKKYIKNCQQHTEGARGFAKQFQMAALGYNPKSQDDEARFNDDFGMKDWGFNPDTKACAEAWHELTNMRIIGKLDVGINPENNEPNQKEVGWIPFGV